MFNLREYSDQYLEFMSKVYKNKHVVNISTITLICNLNVEKIDIKQFTETFSKPNVNVKISKSNKDYELSKRGKVKKTFFNQVSLNYHDISRKSIKIFSNGKLQITGLSSFYECNLVVNMVIQWLQEIFTTERIELVDAYIGMINSNFSIHMNLDLINLNKILNRNDNIMSIYNPESYPAINMKMRTDIREYVNDTTPSVSIFIFGTGNIVITGGKTLQDIITAYTFIVDTIRTNESDVKKNTLHTPKSHKKEYIIEGYNIRQYMSCISE